MTNGSLVKAATHPPIKLFVFPRMFEIPNLSPFCCKMETWLRMARVPYELVETRDPRSAPRKKLPFIEDGGARIADSSLIVEHLSRTRAVDLDAGLSAEQRAIATLVKRTLEEHYAFVLAYTHLFSDESSKYTRSRFDVIPALIRPLVERAVRKNVKNLLWYQGILRGSHDEILASAIDDWRAVLPFMSEGPFFFGERVTTTDAIVFGTLAPTLLTPIETPIRAFLLSQPKAVAYAERLRAHFFPELAPKSQAREPALRAQASA
jgi:glutathione S-transferase